MSAGMMFTVIALSVGCPFVALAIGTALGRHSQKKGK